METVNEIEVFVTPVFERIEECRKVICANIGGARSSKSYSIAQVLIQKFVNEENKNILVCRKTLPSLKLTCLPLIISLLQEYGIWDQCSFNQSVPITIRYRSNQFVFLSIDDPEKIKSTEWHYEWIEEANELDFQDFVTLKTRLSGPAYKCEYHSRRGGGENCEQCEHNQIFLSYNPMDEGDYLNTKLQDERSIEYIHSTYKDNPTLSDEYIRLLEDLEQQDEASFKIFAKGEYSKVQGIIYQPYTIIHPENWPEHFDEVIYGLDFGFNNPTALLEIGIKDFRKLYLRQRLYKSGLNNSKLIIELESLVSDKSNPIYADAEDPNRIDEIHNEGFNIHPADKGQDSVIAGIQFVKSFSLFSRSDNTDLHKERGIYKFRTDKNGKVLDEPVKFMNHLMDAKRYAIYTHFRGKVKGGRKKLNFGSVTA